MFETIPEIGDTWHKGPHGIPQDTAIYILSLIDDAEGHGPMMQQNTSILSVLYWLKKPFKRLRTMLFCVGYDTGGTVRNVVLRCHICGWSEQWRHKQKVIV